MVIDAGVIGDPPDRRSLCVRRAKPASRSAMTCLYRSLRHLLYWNAFAA